MDKGSECLSVVLLKSQFPPCLMDTLSECHVTSALCIALPRPKSGPAETTLGNSWRSAHPPCPFRALAAPQPPPPPCGGWVGTPLKVGTPSTSLSSFEEEEFSTHRYSGLCFRDRQHVRAEICSRVAYF